MAQNSFFYLPQAAELLSEKTGHHFSQEDLIIHAQLGQLLMYYKATAWPMIFNYETHFSFSGIFYLDKERLEAAMRALRDGEKYFFAGFSVKTTVLAEHGVYVSMSPKFGDTVSINAATETACLFDESCLIVDYQHSILGFLENCYSPEKFPANINRSAETVILSTGNPLPDYGFISVGEYYDIYYEGVKSSLQKTQGLLFIELLIRNKGRKMRVDEMDMIINPPDLSQVDSVLSHLTAEQLIDEGLSLGNVGQRLEIFDKQARQSIQQAKDRLLSALEIAIESGNTEEQYRLAEELNHIQQFEPKLYKGKVKTSDEVFEKQRQKIAKSIKYQIDKLKTSSPAFATHLETSISKGKYCQYHPNPELNWQFE